MVTVFCGGVIPHCPRHSLLSVSSSDLCCLVPSWRGGLEGEQRPEDAGQDKVGGSTWSTVHQQRKQERGPEGAPRQGHGK